MQFDIELHYDEPHYRAWRSGFCDGLLNLDTPRAVPSGFAGAARCAPFGEAVVVDIEHRSGPVRVERGRARVTRPNPVDYGLFAVRAGETRLSAGGPEQTLSTGEVALIHRSQPFSISLLPGLELDLLLFRESLISAAAGHRGEIDAPATVPRTALAELLGTHLRTMSAESAAFDREERSAVLNSLAELVAAVYTHRPVDEGRSRQAARDAQLAHVMSLLERNLSDPELRPERLARMAGISVRYLHRLFEMTGRSVGATIRDRRLDRARDELSDPASHHRTITDIAFRWGFNDSAHFSRCFKARFDMTPSNARRVARSVAPSPREGERSE